MEASRNPTRTVVYHVDRGDVITRVGGGWSWFAGENGVPELTPVSVIGRSVHDYVADPSSRHVYRALLKRVRESGVPVEFNFRCDAPALRRFMRMHLIPGESGEVTFRSETVRVEPRTPVLLLDAHEPRTDEHIGMCGWCKRVSWQGAWVEVERFVAESDIMEEAALPWVTHGICPDCEEALVGAVDKSA